MATVRFCRFCNNILYPMEETKPKILYYACRTCGYKEETDDHVVYVAKINPSIGESSQSSEDAPLYSTYPSTKSVRCPKCDHDEAFFFQDIPEGEEKKELFFVCCSLICQHKWKE